MALPNLNMLTDPAFPVVTASSQRRWAAFADLLDESGDFPVAFGWPRGDLNVASAELAIGLLSLVYRPERHKDWEAIWNGRSEVDIAARIAVLAPHFNLLGDAEGKGPRFCQDYEELAGEANAIEALFIDTPGVNGQKKNSDLLTHRERFPALGLKAAAIALYTLQQFAPAGGAGIRTSMRGGGPLTTLVRPVRGDGPAPLRRFLVLNMPVQFGGDDWLEDAALHRALPWLKPTITSEGKNPREVAEADPAAHPAQAFFGMPRRIRLVAGKDGICPLTGETGPLITGFIQKPWGTSYSIWRHPLTPYRQTKTADPYTAKPKSGRFAYRDWVGATVGRSDEADKAFPATAVQDLKIRQASLRQRNLGVHLLAAGWAMNNMEAESYLHSVQPLYVAPEGREDIAALIAETARNFADAGGDTAQLLRKALNGALFDGHAKSTDAGVFDEATHTFFERSDTAFHEALGRIVQGEAALDEDAAEALTFLRKLRAIALAIFDEHATALLAGSPDVRRAMRVTSAYEMLRNGLSERSKIAQALCIPQPVKVPKESKS